MNNLIVQLLNNKTGLVYPDTQIYRDLHNVVHLALRNQVRSTLWLACKLPTSGVIFMRKGYKVLVPPSLAKHYRQLPNCPNVQQLALTNGLPGRKKGEEPVTIQDVNDAWRRTVIARVRARAQHLALNPRDGYLIPPENRKNLYAQTCELNAVDPTFGLDVTALDVVMSCTDAQTFLDLIGQ